MMNWTDQVRAQVHLLVQQIAGAQARGRSAEGSGIESYYRMLEELFDRDLRLAELRDKSDLMLHLEGEAFDQDPSIQLVTSIFNNVSSQVTELTRAILGVWAEGRITPKAIDLGLSGVARGSLYFGISAQPPGDKSPLLGELDTLHDSTKRALRVIDDVAHVIEGHPDHVSVEEVSEVIVDPKVRDAALVAVQRLTPTGRRGINTLTVSGQAGKPAELTPDHRRAIRESLSKPVLRGEEILLEGHVREIDLDSRRFDLRNIINQQLRDVRCAYRDVEVSPRNLLGSRVRVRGLVERAQDEVPRLMSVLSLEILDRSPKEAE